MHAVIIHNLEDYLSGTLPPEVERGFQRHLGSCAECRQEIQSFEGVSELVGSLKPDAAVEPSAGFVARVMQEVGLRPAPSFWGLLTDSAFGRRVVFASLVTLAVLGSVVISRETSYAPQPPTPDVVMAADQDSPSPGSMLVTLASYEP
jgi:anti-sigma factor RsiW